MIWGPKAATRDLPRLREIGSVLIRHGLGDLVRRTGLATVLERAGEILHWADPSKTASLEPQQRMRHALEDLGPTFVKLGQVLSTRPDLLSPSWISELERLHSDVAPVAFDELLPQIEEALGRSPFDVFAEVEHEPHAAASIAQVHLAKLASGAKVALKIRRPGIPAKIDADLRLLDQLAHLIESELPEARRYAPIRIVSEFRHSLNRELDLALEGRNIQRFARNFADDPNIVIPKVYSQWTSSAMNVQEYIEGIRGTDSADIAAAGLDRKVLAARGADAVLKMILVDGFFHADPHPGNDVTPLHRSYGPIRHPLAAGSCRLGLDPFYESVVARLAQPLLAQLPLDLGDVAGVEPALSAHKPNVSRQLSVGGLPQPGLRPGQRRRRRTAAPRPGATRRTWRLPISVWQKV
jgi:ubiquinone biosynthesis protein